MPEFIAEVTVSGKTSDSSFENLLPEGTYYAFAVCVANDGTCISEATVETIRTSESPKNSYTVSSEVVTDVAYSAIVTAEQSEAFAVMMELQEPTPNRMPKSFRRFTMLITRIFPNIFMRMLRMFRSEALFPTTNIIF